MNRRGFTFGAFFASIGAAISKALGYDGTVLAPPAPLPAPEAKARTRYVMKLGRHFWVDGEPVKDLPEGVKHWSEAPHVVRPRPDGPAFTTVNDLKQLRDEIDLVRHGSRDEIRDALFALWRKLDDNIKRIEHFCDGHNGPALGLTKEHCMTDMGDGRRLCPYCYNKEIADGRAGTNEGRPAS